MRIQRPRRRYYAKIEVETHTREEFEWSMSRAIAVTLRKDSACSIGGGFTESNWEAEYEEAPSKTEEVWSEERKEWLKFNKAEAKFIYDWPDLPAHKGLAELVEHLQAELSGVNIATQESGLTIMEKVHYKTVGKVLHGTIKKALEILNNGNEHT